MVLKGNIILIVLFLFSQGDLYNYYSYTFSILYKKEELYKDLRKSKYLILFTCMIYN